MEGADKQKRGLEEKKIFSVDMPLKYYENH
jgi:hypothetical protein